MNKLFAIVPIFLLAGFLMIDTYTSEEDYRLVWSDEFNYSGFPKDDKWNVEHSNGCPNMCGFGNNEAQYYTRHQENVHVNGEHLVITARQDTIGENYYTSAKLTTKNKGDWQSGKIDIRAILPKGTGTWPAFWMLPTLDQKMKWPLDGEIDIMEHVGYHPGWIYGTIHTEKYNHKIGTQKSDSIFVDNAQKDFHTYSLEWTENQLKWSVDNKEYFTYNKGTEGKPGWPFDASFHLIINLAVGGNWGGKEGIDPTIFPSTMVIDYVRVYQRM